MKPAWDDGWAQMYVGDSIDVLSQLPEKSVHCCVTSPPYFGLRSYLPSDHPDKAKEGGAQETPEAYVEWMVQVFRTVWKVLRDDGTCWINLGDSYAANGGADPYRRTTSGKLMPPQGRAPAGHGLKPKDLLMIPARVALALQADGWYLRSQIVWAKPNPMPESVTDRPTQATEMVYLFSKKPRYFYDAEAVREQASESNGWAKQRANGLNTWTYNDTEARKAVTGQSIEASTRNLRNYWQISTRPYPGSHYATFPPELPMRCIKAGTSERGVCSECGAPWRRITERVDKGYDGSRYGERAVGASGGAITGGTARSTLGSSNGKLTGDSRTIGFEPTCEHFPRQDSGKGSVSDPVRPHSKGRGPKKNFGNPTKETSGWEPGCEHSAEVIPATVLDPFSGSGTTGLIARKLGRRSILVDLDDRNVKLLEERMGYQGVLL
jgi:DNA modification methylase